MTPEERIERLEREQEEHGRWMREMEKRHEENRLSHESWLLDHEHVMREMEQTMSALVAGSKTRKKWQKITEQELKAFINSLRRGGNGRG